MFKLLLLRVLINTLGLWLSAELLPGVSHEGGFSVVVMAAIIFSIVNAIIRPVVILLSLPAIVLTLGFFTLIINALMLYLVTVFYEPFMVSSFSSAVLAVIIVWLVNYGLSAIVQRDEYERLL